MSNPNQCCENCFWNGGVKHGTCDNKKCPCHSVKREKDTLSNLITKEHAQDLERPFIATKLEDPQEESWEEALQFEVMEDYLMDAEGMSPGESKTAYMREHFEKLKSFISKTLLSQKQQLYKELREKIEKMRSNLRLMSRTEDKAVYQTEGYNQALDDIKNILKSIINKVL